MLKNILIDLLTLALDKHIIFLFTFICNCEIK